MIAPAETNIVKSEKREEKSEANEGANAPKKSGALFMNEPAMNHNNVEGRSL